MVAVGAVAAGADGAGAGAAPTAPAGLVLEACVTVFLGGGLAVTTAIEMVAATSTAVIAITVRWPVRPPGKLGLRIPSAIDTITAHRASVPPAM